MNTTTEQPKMLPFNLERALAGDPVVYRDGTPVLEVIRFKGGNVARPLVSITEFSIIPAQHYENGQVLFGASGSALDLFMAPKTTKVWVNLYGDSYHVKVGLGTHRSKGSALSVKSPQMDGLPYITTIEVEVPE